MAQISLYIDDAIASKLSAVAKANNCSVSKFVTSVLTERFADQSTKYELKRQLLSELRGAIDDATLVEPPEIPWELDAPRPTEMFR
ncbi:MAG: hypothetical protein LBN02_06640 [Oscillospiraceae bacterium]|jgi:hypothetical protein|nr:hypothetical protein [Oscillospiraceae bacterium]